MKTKLLIGGISLSIVIGLTVFAVIGRDSGPPLSSHIDDQPGVSADKKNPSKSKTPPGKQSRAAPADGEYTAKKAIGPNKKKVVVDTESHGRETLAEDAFSPEADSGTSLSATGGVDSVPRESMRNEENFPGTVIPGALPPELEEINRELKKMALDIERTKNRLDKEAKAMMDSQPDNPEETIERADLLIERVNAQHGIDSSAIKSRLEEEIRKPPTSPEAVAISKELDRVDADLLDLERRLEQLEQSR